MIIIGVTGSFGTGKSFVASLFRSHGARVIDADAISRDALSKGAAGYGKVVRAFGKDILNKGGDVDRKKLAAVVFSDGAKLRKLNSIIHPVVIKDIKRRLSRESKNAVVVVDAPLLIEAGLHKMADMVVVVKASRAKQIARCMKKFRITKAEFLKRERRQIPLREKVALADIVIDNDGSRSKTRKQVKEAWDSLWK